MLRRILVALKFGPAGIEAVKNSIEIFHALDYSLQNTDEEAPEFVEIKNRTKKRYLSEIEPLTENLTNVVFRSLPADPALEVCKQARDLQADLIVLGCHQLSEKISMGRLDYVGITILEKAPCPVMLVPYSGSS
ncbi:MAG: universal stress protein [Desulfobacterales bacterium]